MSLPSLSPDAESDYEAGRAAADAKDWPSSVHHFERVIRAHPEHAKAHNNLGRALASLGDSVKGIESYSRAIELAPDYAEAYYNRGTARGVTGKMKEALEDFDRAVVLGMDTAYLHNNRGCALEASGDIREALKSYQKAVAIDPRFIDAHNNIGQALHALNDLDGALASYERALAIDPSYLPAHNNRAFVLLSLGRFAEGWREHEWRQPVLFGSSRRFAVPQWTGREPLAGKTILVHVEQGVGDTLQFCRYLPLLQRKGAHVLVGLDEGDSALKVLLPGLGAPFEFVEWRDPAVTFDYHCPMMSLPFAFGTDLSSIPQTVPGLSAPPARAALWRRRIGGQGIRIGISWQGNPSHRRDRFRSFPLALFSGLAETEGVRLINLHKGAGERQIAAVPFRVENYSREVSSGPTGWLDTAAVMSACDLVIACDTAVAHLAGTLRLPVWLLVDEVADWRWLRERTDSPWYPSMRIFRQRASLEWKEVFLAIEKALESGREALRGPGSRQR